MKKDRCFSLVPSEHMRYYVHSLKYKRVYLSKKDTFVMGVVKHGNRLFKKGSGVIILGDSQNVPGHNQE